MSNEQEASFWDKFRVGPKPAPRPAPEPPKRGSKRRGQRSAVPQQQGWQDGHNSGIKGILSRIRGIDSCAFGGTLDSSIGGTLDSSSLRGHLDSTGGTLDNSSLDSSSVE